MGFLAFAGWFGKGSDPALDRQGAEAGSPAAGEGPGEGQDAGPGPRGEAPNTFIGPAVRLAGAIRCDRDLTVEGRVEGPVSAKGRVVVARGGSVQGDIHAAGVRIRGQTQGTLVSSGEIHIEAGGEHRGSLQTRILVVEAGAVVEGEVRAGRGAPGNAGPEGGVG